MSKLISLYDPHEDGAGCSAPKPPALTEVLSRLDRTQTTLDAALAAIRAAVPDGDVKDCGDYIYVGLGELIPYGAARETRQYHYRAIRYDVVSNVQAN